MKDRATQLLVAGLCFAVHVASSGCDECKGNEAPRCDGNALRTCEWLTDDHRYVWQETPCYTRYCIEGINELLGITAGWRSSRPRFLSN